MRVESGSSPLPVGAEVGARAAAPGFEKAMELARTPPASRTVVSGDTLVAVVRQQAAQQGVALSPGQTLRQAHQLARDSGIANPDRIQPGQTLALQGLQARLAALPGGQGGASGQLPAAQVLASARPSATADTTQPAASSRRAAAAYATGAAVQPRPVRELQAGPAQPAQARPGAPAAPVAAATAEPAASRSFLAGPHPVLEQTLDRAVARGFIPAIERGDVYDKILELAARHRFRPDDFARMTLMESDGLNPRASNERCHGIIQFCDGSDRGAATVGYAANPRVILGFSVYQQLHLVDRYFSEVGVKPAGEGPASLDDLYLSVLMPAARGQADPTAALPIPGPQASVLHVGRDRSAPITRQSILEGLQQNAQDRLVSYAQRMRPQALREDMLLPGQGTRLR